MMRRHGEGPAWASVNRLRRRCGFDHNELRRDIDRRQRSIGLVLITCAMGTIPAAALPAAHVAYANGVRIERAEAAGRHQVTATVVDPGSQKLSARRGIWVTWTGPDGARHTDVAVIWRGKPDKGESQQIWVDASGRPTIRPRARAQTLIDGWAAGLGTSAGVGVAFLMSYKLLRRRYDRRRYRDWDTAWTRFDTHSAS